MPYIGLGGWPGAQVSPVFAVTQASLFWAVAELVRAPLSCCWATFAETNSTSLPELELIVTGRILGFLTIVWVGKEGGIGTGAAVVNGDEVTIAPLASNSKTLGSNGRTLKNTKFVTLQHS